MARKIGMDEAVRRFERIKKEDGIIVCFDADSECAANYFIEVEKHFNQSGQGACSIYFEHPISGQEFSKEIENFRLMIFQQIF